MLNVLLSAICLWTETNKMVNVKSHMPLDYVTIDTGKAAGICIRSLAKSIFQASALETLTEFTSHSTASIGFEFKVVLTCIWTHQSLAYQTLVRTTAHYWYICIVFCRPRGYFLNDQLDYAGGLCRDDRSVILIFRDECQIHVRLLSNEAHCCLLKKTFLVNE